MASHFPLRDLYDEVKAWYVAKSDPAEHLFGSQGHFERKNTNCFTWVPKLSRRIDQEGLRGIDKHKVNFGAEHIVEIYCWGASDEIAYLMAENVMFAIRELGRADINFLGAEWHDYEDQGATELGAVYVVEVGLKAAFIRRYTSIETYTGTVATPVPPNVPTTDPTGVEITTYATESIAADGELMGSDTVTG